MGKSLDKWGIVCMHADRKRADINIFLCTLSKPTEIQKCAHHAHAWSNLYCQKITAKKKLGLFSTIWQRRWENSLHCALFSEDEQSDQRIHCTVTSSFPSQWVQLSQAGRVSKTHHTLDSCWLLLGWKERKNIHQALTKKALVTSQAVNPLSTHSGE